MALEPWFWLWRARKRREERVCVAGVGRVFFVFLQQFCRFFGFCAKLGQVQAGLVTQHITKSRH